MKQLLLLSLLLLSTFVAFGQQDGDEGPPPEEKKDLREIFNRVERMPQFDGGEEALKRYLRDNGARLLSSGSTKGAVMAFLVEPDGSLTRIRILRGYENCRSCQKELIGIIKGMPKWIPGEQADSKVVVQYNLQVLLYEKK